MQEKRINELVAELNKHRHAYYNENAPEISDADYDRLFDELTQLEKETGIILSNSPTQTVGYTPVSNLEKTRHEVPLLSLDKTKAVSDLFSFAGAQTVLMMHKLDGLTLDIKYDNGRLQSASTRGDGIIGEIVTHNVPAISGIPIEIPYKSKLEITGEGYINDFDFEILKDTLLDSTGKPYRNARNLAAGSIRCLDPAACVQRCVRFAPFNVLVGLDEDAGIKNSKFLKLLRLQKLGFAKCQSYLIQKSNKDVFEKTIQELQKSAEANGIPIDGVVVTYNDVEFSRSCGRTGHHYKDGIAYKFADESFETVLIEVEWNTSRSGEIAPVGIFDTVEIDGCEVSRASLHNLSFIEGLGLNTGCRILVSKRNMIIPHVEENLDRDKGTLIPPAVCPRCGQATYIKLSDAKDSETKTLHCENPDCPAKNLKKFVHFVENKAMNIDGLSEATLERFFDRGWLRTFTDIYKLSSHKDEIIAMEGFGAKSYAKIIEAIEKSRHTTFANFLIALDIPMVGRGVSKILYEEFNGDLTAFRATVESGRDFTAIKDVGDTINNNIHTWFSNPANCELWDGLYPLMIFEQPVLPAGQGSGGNPFAGLTVVVTGTLQNFTRETINTKLEQLGAKAGDTVSKKTNYVIAGKKAGSKLKKAEDLGVPVLTEEQFLAMIGK